MDSRTLSESGPLPAPRAPRASVSAALSQTAAVKSFKLFLLGDIPPPPRPECADYEAINNVVTRSQVSPRFMPLVRWALYISMAIVMASFYKGISTFIEWVFEEKFHFVEKNLLKGDFWKAYAVYTAIMFALTISVVVIVILHPPAAGSGVAEVVSYLNGVKTPSTVAPLTFVAKAIGLMLIIPSGLAVGPEGPMIHLGAIIGMQLVALLVVFFPRAHAVRVLQMDIEERNLMLVGAGTGIAVAFRAPIAGVMFVLEEAISFFSGHIIFPVYVAGVVGYFFLMLLNNPKTIPPAEKFSEFDLFEACLVAQDWENIVLFAILGCLCGVLGAAFNAISVRLMRFRRMHINKLGWRRLLEASVIVMLTASLHMWVPAGWGCTPAKSLISHVDDNVLNRHANSNDKYLFDDQYCLAVDAYQFFAKNNFTKTPAMREFLQSAHLNVALCSQLDEYNELESLLQSSGKDAAQLLFSLGTYNDFSAGALAVFYFIYFFLAVISAGMSVPGGLVIPMLLLGGSMGRLFGVLTNAWFKAPLGRILVDPGGFAIVGAAAHWCGSSRITVTIALIVVELTGMATYLPAIAIAVTFSRVVADRLTFSLDHEIIHLKGYPFLEDITPKALAKASVKDVMDTPVVFFPRMLHIERLRHVLSTTTHNGFPIVDETAVDAVSHAPLVGLALRRDLLRLMRAAKRAGKVMLDCELVMNESPQVVEPHFTATQAFALFRSMGLRHLTVIDRNFRVVGLDHKIADSLASKAVRKTSVLLSRSDDDDDDDDDLVNARGRDSSTAAQSWRDPSNASAGGIALDPFGETPPVSPLHDYRTPSMLPGAVAVDMSLDHRPHNAPSRQGETDL